MCKVMWSDSFSVSNDDTRAYTMSFTDGFNNPNDIVTKNLGKSIEQVKGHDKCGLQYYHYNRTQKQTTGKYGMCTNYKENACCKPSTVQSWAQINANYGEAYHADRCGPLSTACQQFFIYETCLYECDANAGLYRMYNDSQVAHDIAISGYEKGTGPGTDVGGIPINGKSNAWKMYKMPIRQSFCDQWYEACYNDNFCSDGSGDFFACAKIYKLNNPEQVALDNAKRMTTDMIILTVILSVFGCCLICFVMYLVYRERQGKAVFQPLLMVEDSDGEMRPNRKQGISLDHSPGAVQA